jgi:hypothetical protein
MGRPRYPQPQPTPPPLPPEQRTIGQLIAEAIRLYYARFWRAIPLGLVAIPFSLAEHAWGGGKSGVPSPAHLGLVLLVEAPALSAAYTGAAVLVLGGAPTRRIVTAWGLGTALYVPFRLLAMALLLPGLVWLALVGLAVPVVIAEGLRPAAAIKRAVALARADLVHALGGLCGLALVTFVAAVTLAILLHTQARNSDLVAIALAQAVLFPILLLGSAMLYVDQAARLRVRTAKEPVAA